MCLKTDAFVNKLRNMTTQEQQIVQCKIAMKLFWDGNSAKIYL